VYEIQLTIQWTPDARRLLTGNDKGQFTLWNGQSFNYESITQVHDDSIRQLAYSHNGQSLVSSDKSGAIKYFTPHLTNVHGFQGHREACHGVAWSPNDEKFVTGGDDGLVKIWNFRAAEEERQLSGMFIILPCWMSDTDEQATDGM
jgi:polyadenylation factor subunit 2